MAARAKDHTAKGTPIPHVLRINQGAILVHYPNQINKCTFQNSSLIQDRVLLVQRLIGYFLSHCGDTDCRSCMSSVFTIHKISTRSQHLNRASNAYSTAHSNHTIMLQQVNLTSQQYFTTAWLIPQKDTKESLHQNIFDTQNMSTMAINFRVLGQTSKTFVSRPYNTYSSRFSKLLTS